MKRRREISIVHRCEGSILIEVVVAIVLLGILIMPLAGAALSALRRADSVGRLAEEAGNVPSTPGCPQAWDWGSRVASATWRPGPTLYIRAGGSADQTPIIGLWVDGWFLGEKSTEGEGVVRLGPATWPASIGRELVIRVRTPGQVWGPPWRSLVPGADGVVSVPAAEQAAAGANGELVAHAPAAGNPGFEFSWTVTPERPGLLGLPVVLTTTPSGPCAVTLGDSAQSLSMDATRGVDVYF